MRTSTVPFVEYALAYVLPKAEGQVTSDRDGWKVVADSPLIVDCSLRVAQGISQLTQADIGNGAVVIQRSARRIESNGWRQWGHGMPEHHAGEGARDTTP